MAFATSSRSGAALCPTDLTQAAIVSMSFACSAWAKVGEAASMAARKVFQRDILVIQTCTGSLRAEAPNAGRTISCSTLAETHCKVRGQQGLRRDWPAERRVGSIFNGAREEQRRTRARQAGPYAAALVSELARSGRKPIDRDRSRAKPLHHRASPRLPTARQPGFRGGYVIWLSLGRSGRI